MPSVFADAFDSLANLVLVVVEIQLSVRAGCSAA
jgi:hypothetical protein